MTKYTVHKGLEPVQSSGTCIKIIPSSERSGEMKGTAHQPPHSACSPTPRMQFTMCVFIERFAPVVA